MRKSTCVYLLLTLSRDFRFQPPLALSQSQPSEMLYILYTTPPPPTHTHTNIFQTANMVFWLLRMSLRHLDRWFSTIQKFARDLISVDMVPDYLFINKNIGSFRNTTIYNFPSFSFYFNGYYWVISKDPIIQCCRWRWLIIIGVAHI